MSHWVTLYDPEDGQPYGKTCRCPIGAGHDAEGRPVSTGLTYVEWAVRSGELILSCLSQDSARAATVATDAVVVCRSVTLGPWVEVPATAVALGGAE